MPGSNAEEVIASAPDSDASRQSFASSVMQPLTELVTVMFDLETQRGPGNTDQLFIVIDERLVALQTCLAEFGPAAQSQQELLLRVETEGYAPWKVDFKDIFTQLETCVIKLLKDRKKIPQSKRSDWPSLVRELNICRSTLLTLAAPANVAESDSVDVRDHSDVPNAIVDQETHNESPSDASLKAAEDLSGDYDSDSYNLSEAGKRILVWMFHNKIHRHTKQRTRKFISNAIGETNPKTQWEKLKINNYVDGRGRAGTYILEAGKERAAKLIKEDPDLYEDILKPKTSDNENTESKASPSPEA